VLYQVRAERLERRAVPRPPPRRVSAAGATPPSSASGPGSAAGEKWPGREASMRAKAGRGLYFGKYPRMEWKREGLNEGYKMEIKKGKYQIGNEGKSVGKNYVA
jgi:hypothetical protein